MKYRACTRCLMDTDEDPDITFDENGYCNYCRDYFENKKNLPQTDEEKKAALDRIVQEIKAAGKGREYDVTIGISGGVDSAYLAYTASKLGLRILAVHVDAGWDTEVAVRNIHKVCSALNLDLHTIVMDWPTMKELQRAYMFSGLRNLDVPQDYCFLTCSYHYTRKHHVKYMLTGSNSATEGILSKQKGYTAIDYTNIKDVYRQCGRGLVSLKKYPRMNYLEYAQMFIGGVKRVDLLNYVPYSQKLAIDTLHREFGWEYYGGKHFESQFTKFFQSYYLPQKFGYNKKKDHLSSLIVGGEMTREEAVKAYEDDSAYPLEKQLEDREYICKKLDISDEEWEQIMSAHPKTEDDYKNDKKKLAFFRKIKHSMGK